MNFLRKIFGLTNSRNKKTPDRIIITLDNIGNWPKFDELFKNGKIKADSTGRFRYLHGAPVGELIFIKIDKDEKPIYKESASEWFDPESPKAKEFIWI